MELSTPTSGLDETKEERKEERRKEEATKYCTQTSTQMASILYSRVKQSGWNHRK